ncbi:hypothetical protein [Pseudomonas sp. S2_C03]
MSALELNHARLWFPDQIDLLMHLDSAVTDLRSEHSLLEPR